jgi:hypothetical protein
MCEKIDEFMSCYINYNLSSHDPSLIGGDAANYKNVSCLAYSLTLKMEATCSSKTSVDFQQTAWHYIPEDRTLYKNVIKQDGSSSNALDLYSGGA